MYVCFGRNFKLIINANVAMAKKPANAMPTIIGTDNIGALVLVSKVEVDDSVGTKVGEVGDNVGAKSGVVLEYKPFISLNFKALLYS